MKVGVVSQWYAPEPAQIPNGVAASLAERGHDVRVLTGYPNYPGGRIYPGYRQRWKQLSVEGRIAVRRVPLYPSHSSSSIGRVANYLSYAATSSLAAPRFLEDVDVLYVYHPPATAFAAAALLRLVKRIPAVLHVQDVWPESVTSSPMSPGGAVGRLLEAALHSVMRRIYQSAAGVVVIAPTMRELMIERGADPTTTRVVFNWANESVFEKRPSSTRATRTAIGDRGRCNIMFAGNIGPFQNLAVAIRSAAAIERSSPVDLVIVGDGIARESAEELTGQLGAGNIRFLGQRPESEMPGLYAAADFQLISLADLPIFRGTIPSKLQSALCAGAPVIVSVPGDCAALVQNAGAGLTCAPDDPTALAKTFAEAARLSYEDRNAISRRGRQFYVEHMSRSRANDVIEEVLRMAAATRSGTCRSAEELSDGSGERGDLMRL